MAREKTTSGARTWRFRRFSPGVRLVFGGDQVARDPANNGLWTRLRILYPLVLACRYECQWAYPPFVGCLRRPRPWDDLKMIQTGA